MRKLSYWTRYILAWFCAIVVYAYADVLGMILGFILALEYFYQRYLKEQEG